MALPTPSPADLAELIAAPARDRDANRIRVLDLLRDGELPVARITVAGAPVLDLLRDSEPPVARITVAGAP